MKGIRGAVIIVDQATHAAQCCAASSASGHNAGLVSPTSGGGNEIIAANKGPDFLWQRYFIASLYRVGYGILAIVTHIV